MLLIEYKPFLLHYKCKDCNRHFVDSPQDIIKCPKCYSTNVSIRGQLPEFMKSKPHCIFCGNDLTPGRLKFCDVLCGKAYEYGLILVNRKEKYCASCGKPIPYSRHYDFFKYCSLTCKNKESYSRRRNQILQYHKRVNRLPEVKAKRNKYQRNRYRTKYEIRLHYSMSVLIYLSLKKNKKRQHWESLVGYTINDLKANLEKQFTGKMCWENYGRYWHIDHRIARSWFNFKSSEDTEFKKCWALENLQPKLRRDNQRKSDRWAEPTLSQIFSEVSASFGERFTIPLKIKEK